MKTHSMRPLAEQISDRSRGSRMQFVTGLTSETGEHALYKKGEEIALQVWLNVDLHERIKGGYVDNIHEMKAKLEQVPDAKLVFSKVRNNGELPPAFIIGNIKGALEVLTAGDRPNITPIAGRFLLKELEEAEKQKTAMDASARSRGGKKTTKPRVTPPQEEDA